jgi:hypothetical protein
MEEWWSSHRPRLPVIAACYSIGHVALLARGRNSANPDEWIWFIRRVKVGVAVRVQVPPLLDLMPKI